MISRLGVAALCMLLLAACSPRNEFAQPPDALVTSSGLASKVLRVGLGNVHPTGTTTVRVNYTGWTPDGVMFDSSVTPVHPGQPAEPIEFPLNRVIPGWTEALQLMVVGEKRRFWIPAKLGYGDPAPGQPAFDPNSGEPPKGPLVFDIDLIAIR